MRFVQSIVFFIALFAMQFEVLALPSLEFKQLGQELQLSRVSSGPRAAFGVTAPPYDGTQVSASEPMYFEWARQAGREEVIWLQMQPTLSQNKYYSSTTYLPSEPPPMIVGKFDPQTNTGMLAIMRMRNVNGTIQAQGLQITPANFQSHWTPSLRNFAWLEWQSSVPGCDAAAWYAKVPDNSTTPMTSPVTISSQILPYDMYGAAMPSLSFSDQAEINKSASYWHQRVNNDPCFMKRGLADFEGGDGLFHNINYQGFLQLAALAQEVHGAPLSFVAKSNIRQDVQTSKHSSFPKVTVTTTISFYLKPDWVVGTRTPTHVTGTQSELTLNPWFNPNFNYNFVSVQGNHSFPVDETMVYQDSKSKKGWSTLFVVILAIVAFAIVAATGGAALGALNIFEAGILESLAAGAAVGAVAGLINTGGKMDTSNVAKISPMNKSTYQLAPTATGDYGPIVAQRTEANWVMPDIRNTQGGVQTFVTKIDFARALACGGASHSDDTCTAPAVETISAADARARGVYDEMFYHRNRLLQQTVQPFER